MQLHSATNNTLYWLAEFREIQLSFADGRLPAITVVTVLVTAYVSNHSHAVYSLQRSIDHSAELFSSLFSNIGKPPAFLLSYSVSSIAMAASSDDKRWEGVQRLYAKQDVDKLRGSMKIEHTLARQGAERLWKLLHTEPYIHALGALTGNQAVQQVQGKCLSS